MPESTPKKPSKPEKPLMSPDQLQDLQNQLGLTHQGMADLLGCSLVSYKRFPVGARPIPAYIARFCIALVVLQKNDLLKTFIRESKIF